MQRTVYSTKFTFVENEVNEKGEIASALRTHEVHESDEKKAYKKAVKEIGIFKPIKIEKVATLYTLEDEIFFKYAKRADTTPETNTGTPEKTEE